MRASAAKRSGGFTLVELLVVILIITILISLLLVALKAVNQAAAESNSLQNLHQIGTALRNYTDKYKLMPPAEAWSLGGGYGQSQVGTTNDGADLSGLRGSGWNPVRRPINSLLAGNDNLAIFESPGDRGLPGLGARSAYSFTGSSYVYLARGGGNPTAIHRFDLPVPSEDNPPEVGADIAGVGSDAQRAQWTSPNLFTAPGRKLVVMDPSLYMPGTHGGYNWSITEVVNQRHNIRNESYRAGSGGPVGTICQQGLALYLDGSATYLIRKNLPNGWPAPNTNTPDPEHDWY